MDNEYKQIAKLFQDNKLDDTYDLIKNKLLQLPTTEFHKILEINWMPLAEAVALYIDKFYKSAKRAIKSIEALYCEMNAYTINYDNWFVQFFAFTKYQGKENLDWLGDYDYTKETALLFTDLEIIQTIFKNYIENEGWTDQNKEEAFDLSELLIILGVQQLFREACVIARAKKYKWATIPVFFNAHDYDDLIYDVTNS